MNIRHFFITDRIKKGDMTVKYCPANDMIADHFTKPLQGDLFHRFRSIIMNVSCEVPDAELSWERDNTVALPNTQECVGGEGSLVIMTNKKLGMTPGVTGDQTWDPVALTFVTVKEVKISPRDLVRERM